MADEVVMTQEVTAPVEESLAEDQKTRRGRKKGTTAKSGTTVKKTAAKTARKKTEKKSAEKTEKDDSKSKTSKKSAVPDLRCKSMTIEFNDKKYTESDLFDRVKAYISTHPYIVAHDIEIFLKPNDSCAYFTIDGFSNPDFRIEL